MALIHIDKISKIYNSGANAVYALNNVSIEIERGEFVAIVGHSGSGKSTLMNVLGCLDRPSSGEYCLSGEKVAELNDRQLSLIRNSQIGFVFQSFNLIPTLNAIENVELPLIYRGLRKSERRRLCTEALNRVGLSGRLHHRPCEMSGGQQQRVAVARALAAHPPIILADEPTGNLDTHSGTEVLDLLRELNGKGETVVLITHDNSIAMAAKRVVCLCDGKIQSDSMN